ncbi:MAG: hypothetical protein ACXVK4_01945 [Acidimicrobiia bacterium]
MKLLIRLTTLALAAFGATELYRRVRPRVEGAESRVGEAYTEHLEPALRNAAENLRATTTQAARDVTEAGHDAVATVSGASEPGGRSDADADNTPDGTAPDVETHDHPVSPMAAHELGLDDDGRLPVSDLSAGSGR